MGLQKKNDVLRSHLIVALFWFVVIFIYTFGFDLRSLSESLAYSMLVILAGIAVGVSLWVAVDMTRVGGILSRYGEHAHRGLKSTLGEIPLPKQPTRAKADDAMLSRRFPWWKSYADSYPEHAAAFRAVLAVMLANPKLPASPVPGGHGGATLIEHSFNVVDTLLEMAPKWSYKGHRNKKGEIVFPLLDTTRVEHRFPPNDPILALAAFAHDVGKVACYQMNPDGSVTEIRKNHDIEGAKLLRTLPEVMALPWKEQVALLSACEFYHHLGALPQSTWINDRARSLVELLIAADVLTGQREGGVIVNDYEDSDGADIQLPQAKVEPDADDEAEVEKMTGEDESAVPDASLPVEHGSALDVTYSVLLEPGRVNGSLSAQRIAWKYGEWLYINDGRLRDAVSARVGDNDYTRQPYRGNMSPFTLDLLAQLAERGALLQELNGRKYSPKRAIYNTTSAVQGKAPVETRFVIVAKVSAFPGLENAQDCKAAPVVVGCTWGDAAAINKNKIESEVDSNHADEEVDNIGFQDTDFTEETGGDAQERQEVEMLLSAAAAMQIPFKEAEYKGADYLFFEEEFLKEEFPEASFSGERFIKRPGGNTGKTFIGVKKSGKD